MKRLLRKTLGTTAIALCMIVLSACGRNDENEIAFTNPFVGADSENFQNMIDAYNATDPEFTVRNVSMEESAMYTNISTVYPTGRGVPDLMIVHAERIQNFVQNDMLMPLNTLLTEFPNINAQNYSDSAWNIGEINGNRYSVPLDIHSWVMYYNKDLIVKYGAEHILDDNIVTYDEIREVAAIVQNADDGTVTFGLTWMWPNFLSLYNQMGGEITQDGINPTIYNDISIRTFEILRDLYDYGFTNENGEDPTQLFETGQLLFLPEGIWYLNRVSEIDAFEWGMIHTPQYSTDNLVNWSSSHQFVLFNSEERSPEKEKAIMHFIDWIRDNSIEWARAGQNPAALAILESAEFQQMPQSFLLSTDENRNSLVIFEYLYNGFVADEINRIGYDIIFGNVDLNEALQTSQRAVEDRIAQDRNTQ